MKIFGRLGALSHIVYYDRRGVIITTVDYVKKGHSHRQFFFMASTTPQWQIIRPWAPSLCLAVREITSVSVTFILSSTLSDREIDPSLASRGLIAAADESDDIQETEPVASSSAISSSLCTNEESLKSQTRSFIANALDKGLLSVTVNGSPWPRIFLHIDEQSDEAVIIVYALMPGRQYDVELGLIPNDQHNNNATTTHLNSQITTEAEGGFFFLFFFFTVKLII